MDETTSGITSETLLAVIAVTAIVAPIVGTPLADWWKARRESKTARKSKLDELAVRLTTRLALELSIFDRHSQTGAYQEMADLRAAFFQWARFVEPHVSDADRKAIDEKDELLNEISGSNVSKSNAIETARLVQRVTLLVSKKL